MKQIDVGLAIRAIIEICKTREGCRTCPVCGICDRAPLEWDLSKVPEIGEYIAVYLGESEKGCTDK